MGLWYKECVVMKVDKQEVKLEVREEVKMYVVMLWLVCVQACG